MSLPQSVRDDAAAVERYLGALFDDMNGPADRLAGSMRYATMNGGKRLRACLVLAAARLAAGSLPEGAMAVAASVECLHAYSLVHDDLPAMDDSDTRRGEPSCHIAFDEATAILAGDALQTLAFELLADANTHADGSVRAALVATLARAAGLDGMAGGQMLDLEAESRAMTLDEVRQMQAMKTGALIQYAAAAGGIHGGADAA
ncbi:MAG: polyprenyl synthetase family protein, partial [Pseudomonadota bacterium]|nr:polyprenyl synthetase family protein [Pseudomonadota bacterium]